jgi:excisionase family DNA binding protein
MPAFLQGAKMLTVKQAAERASVSPALVYQWCEERRLIHYRVGGKGKRGKLLIDAADLDNFMESLRVETGDVPGRQCPQKKFRHLTP